MHTGPVLLFVAMVTLALGCTGAPTKREPTRNAIHSITNMAQTTLVHIKTLRTKLPVAPQIEVSTPSVKGLTSISHELGELDEELRRLSVEMLSQIQADVSSLGGRVRSLALNLDCPVQSGPRGEAADHVFPDSHLYVSLTKVQQYLEKVLLNKDKLKIC
ncbi:leptin-B-like [Lampris incognitus]|uniref:leptin-B-like n=1 Tax=Lampris incognitus TaxID=2546036 RepID=UPI0024B4923C|nr:leptin-B-like [Lampris incognitus]XP_056133725.1 leptin-B-like [Lampris incognitus]